MQYIIQQGLCPKSNYIWYIETSWYRKSRGQWDLLDQTQETEWKRYRKKITRTHHHEQTNNELPAIPLQSSFQPEPDNQDKQSLLLEDAQVLQKVWDQLPTLLQAMYDSIVSISLTDTGGTNLFEMDIPIIGPPIAHKLYPSPFWYQKFIDEEKNSWKVQFAFQRA